VSKLFGMGGGRVVIRRDDRKLFTLTVSLSFYLDAGQLHSDLHAVAEQVVEVLHT
jgi:hypothetical protein